MILQTLAGIVAADFLIGLLVAAIVWIKFGNELPKYLTGVTRCGCGFRSIEFFSGSWVLSWIRAVRRWQHAKTCLVWMVNRV